MTRYDDEGHVMSSGSEEPRFELTLFVSGASGLSARAIADATQLCELNLGGRYHLSVIDVNENPAAVLSSGVVAAPTLVKHRPEPARNYVGDLSRTDKVLSALDLPSRTTTPR